MNLVPYHPSDKDTWNAFLVTAKNSHFMFYREYMDYHSDRFIDASLLIYRDKELVALFPANIDGEVVHSHQGLTFGGLIMSQDIRCLEVVEIFNTMKKFYKNTGVKKIRYKPVPHIYHACPSEEDLYALHKVNALLVQRDFISVISLSNKPKFSRLRKRSLAKAVKHNLWIKESIDFVDYWAMLVSELRSRHHAVPTHSVEEIKSLAEKFPSNIKLFLSYSLENTLLAGLVLYINSEIVNIQYISSTEEGRSIGAVDILVDYVVNQKYASKQWISFGVSSEKQGLSVNEGLVRQKEGFGARAVAADCYEIILGA